MHEALPCQPRLGSAEPGWQLQAVAIAPYLGLLDLTPRPQRPWSQGPLLLAPQTDVTGFPLFGEGVRGCPLN